jgi:hypothetical protein
MASVESSFCPACGKPLAPSDSYCANCGRPRTSTALKRSDRLSIIVGVILIGLVVLLGAGVYVVLNLSRFTQPTQTALVHGDPRTFALQPADFPGPTTSDISPLSADQLFSPTGGLAGAKPIDKYAETVDLQVPSDFQLNRVSSAVAIYPTVADASAVHVGKSFMQYEVPVRSKVGDQVQESLFVGKCANGSTCVYQEQIAWRFRNAVGYVVWQYLSTAPDGIPAGATDVADQEAWGMAERMQTYMRLAAGSGSGT